MMIQPRVTSLEPIPSDDVAAQVLRTPAPLPVPRPTWCKRCQLFMPVNDQSDIAWSIRCDGEDDRQHLDVHLTPRRLPPMSNSEEILTLSWPARLRTVLDRGVTSTPPDSSRRHKADEPPLYVLHMYIEEMTLALQAVGVSRDEMLSIATTVRLIGQDELVEWLRCQPVIS